MRAFSATKYLEPKREVDRVVLTSIDTRVRVEISEPIKYIDRDNNSRVYKPLKLTEKVTG